MPHAPSDRPARPSRVPLSRHRFRARLVWPLALPAAALAWPPLYNRADPHLFGVPFFYAYQLALVPLAAAVTALVHRRSGRGRRHP